MARALGHVRPAISEGDLSLGGIRVVPADIPPAESCRLGGLPVRLYHHAVAVVIDILVLTPATPAHGVLPAPGRQAVRALDAVDIAEFKKRVHAGRRQAERGRQFAAPSASWAARPGPR